MKDFLKNYDNYEYCEGNTARTVGGLLFDFAFAAVGAVAAILLGCIGYHLILLAQLPVGI